MKKALIILYYWPPAGGSAVQRWLKFSKYLPENGWQPVIYAPENASYPETDVNLLKEIPSGIEVIKRPILEPFNLYRKFVGIGKDEQIGPSMTLRKTPTGLALLKNNFALWIRSNIFIPDARFFWIRPSVKYLSRYLTTKPVDVIITTGPPQSMHLIGYHLHKRLRIPWVADFRDPWTNIDFYQDLKLTRWADKRHHTLEARVLKSATAVVTVGPDMKREFEAIGARNVRVITNGFDESDLLDVEATPAKKFTIVHLGTLSGSRNVPALWKALSDEVRDNSQFASDLVIKLYGNVDHSVFKDIESHGLIPHVKGTGFISHPEAIKVLCESHLLLLLINKSNNSKGVITGKFFEYLATGNPILLIGPLDGDAAAILAETCGGFAADYEDIEKMRLYINQLYQLYRDGGKYAYESKITRFTRKALTSELAVLLDDICDKAENPNK